jgi:hypothetical protein
MVLIPSLTSKESALRGWELPLPRAISVVGDRRRQKGARQLEATKHYQWHLFAAFSTVIENEIAAGSPL